MINSKCYVDTCNLLWILTQSESSLKTELVAEFRDTAGSPFIFMNLHTSVTWFGYFLILRYFWCKRTASSKLVIKEWVLKRIAVVLQRVVMQMLGKREDMVKWQTSSSFPSQLIHYLVIYPRHRLELSLGSTPRQVHTILPNLAYDLNFM